MEIWQVVNEALTVLIVALVALVAWYLRQWLRGQLTAGQLDMLSSLTAMAVHAAEQYGGSGEDKKRQAVATAEAWLTERGIFLDLNSLDAAIEAAVWQELNRFKSLDPMEPMSWIPGAAGHKAEASE